MHSRFAAQMPPTRGLLRRTSRSFISLKGNTHLHQKLNFYVIARAMEFLELQDLVGAMGACRCLHYLGLPILLREMQLLFHDAEKSAVRFELYRWHLLKNPIRFSWVSSLCCSGDALYPGESEATARSSLSKPGYNLVDFMPYLTRLRVLDIEMHEQLLSPLVSQWIISLQGLRRLTLRHVANEVQPILDLMAQLGHKELDAIAISMSQSTQSVAVGPAFDPISTLSSFANSLKSLSIDWSDCRQAAVIPADMQHTYPAVQELYWNTPQCIHVGALIRAFPGARNLRVGERALDRVMPPLYSGAISERVMLAQRQRNFSAQNDPGMRWASLESLHGDPLVLWILAIRCRVARLETDLRSYRSTMGHLLSALHDTTPAHLVLSLSAKDVVNLDRVFNVPSLRTLKLTVDVHDEIHVLALLESVLEETYESELRQVTCFIQLSTAVPETRAWHRVVLRGQAPPLFPGSPSCRVPAWWRAFAGQAMTAMPHLEELRVTVQGYQPFEWIREETGGHN